MKRHTRRRGLWIFLLALVLIIALAVCSMLFPSRFPVLSSAFGTVITPVQTQISGVVNWGRRLSDSFSEYDAVKAENEALRREIAEMEAKIRAAERSEAENKRLRTLLRLQEKHRDFRFETAMVSARGSSNWSSTLTLNKGAGSGVAVGNCVVTETGALVGIVKEIGLNWCTVITVIDTDLEIGGLIHETGETGVLEGDFSLMTEGKLRLSYLPRDSTVSSGNVILTSGRGGRYPEGLLVGRVSEAALDVAGMAPYAIVTPEVDLDDLPQVFIIKSFELIE